jgi:hypothetical protein
MGHQLTDRYVGPFFLLQVKLNPKLNTQINPEINPKLNPQLNPKLNQAELQRRYFAGKAVWEGGHTFSKVCLVCSKVCSKAFRSGIRSGFSLLCRKVCLVWSKLCVVCCKVCSLGFSLVCAWEGEHTFSKILDIVA